MKGLKQFGLLLCAGVVGAIFGIAVTMNWPNLSAAEPNAVGHEHSLQSFAAVAATCENTGMRAYWGCPICALYFSDADGINTVSLNELSIPKLSHQSGEQYHHHAVEPTCTTEGSREYWVCVNGCGNYFEDKQCTQKLPKDAVTLSMVKHQSVKVSAKAATCAEPGNLEHYVCQTCHQTFDDKACTQPNNQVTVVVAHQTDAEHYRSRVEATCETAGHEAHYVCINCDATFSDAQCQNAFDPVLEPLGHISDNTHHYLPQAATCTEDGHLEYWECVHGCHQKFAEYECETLLTDAEVILPNFGGHQLVAIVAPEHLKSEAILDADGLHQAVYYQTCTHCGAHIGEKTLKNSFAKLVDGTFEIGSDADKYFNLFTIDSTKLAVGDDGQYHATVQIKVPDNYLSANSQCGQIDNLCVENGIINLQICLENLPTAEQPIDLIWEFDWDGNGNYEQTIKVQIML